ncbi:hypothetical protein VTJ83DRAFT_6605 [Remersonia thermophila]|uniref:Uncharacterized protein n=1 Tax=Remersonia thermophila TaxID=72144 RepID=A0ABR4D5A8_9PEZI
MTSAPDLNATLSFLTDAAHLLTATSPETSAYLMSRRNDLMFAHEMPLSDKQRQQVCTSCGNILLLGHGSQMEIRSEKRPRNKKKKKSGAATVKSRTGPAKVITCGRCSRVTNVQLPAPPPVLRPKMKGKMGEKMFGHPGVAASAATTPPLSMTTEAELTQPKPTSSSAGSKKRAKSRKAGLQALLSQSGSSRPGLGLSLADFLDKK